MTSEHDLEQLEAMLDGELTVDEEYALRQRVAADPALATALDGLRAERETRARAWQAMEPRDAELTALLSRVRADVRREELWNQRRRALRYVSALAACVLVGFMMGRFLPYGASADRDAGNGIVVEPGRGPLAEVMDTRPAQSQAPPRTSGFRVLLTDNVGQVIAEQRFDTYDEAREFTEDLRSAQYRYNAPARRPPQQAPQPRVVDTFFTKGQF